MPWASQSWWWCGGGGDLKGIGRGITGNEGRAMRGIKAMEGLEDQDKVFVQGRSVH